jgi:hypothetical protein
MIAAVAANRRKTMEIKKPTLRAIDPKIFEQFETLRPETDASQIASEINKKVALKQKLEDVKEYLRNNDVKSSINELLEGNQTLREQKTQLHPRGSRVLDVFESGNKLSEIEQTQSRIEEERKAAVVNLVGSSVGAAASFGMGAGAYASAGAASAKQEEASSDDSKIKSESKKAQSELEIFQARIRKLLA